MLPDLIVMGLYVLGMLAIGAWGMRRSRSRGDYLLAGRRLGVFSYASAMSALILGGASTVGGVALGYEYGLSGAWLVTAIALGLAVLSAFFAKRLAKLGVSTVTQMLELRYGGGSALFPGLIMLLYTFMLAVTSTLAYATVFHVVLGVDEWAGILIGGLIVLVYSNLGGMWSITLTDVIQLIITTIGLLLVLLPISLAAAGGPQGMAERLEASFFSPWSIGGATIVTYIVAFSLGMLIGQDIWQRLFTARTPRIALAGGLASSGYAIIYGLAGAVIGMAARVLLPELEDPDTAFAQITQMLAPAGVRGLVFAAALAAMMSTASGAIIACATVFTADLLPLLRGGRGKAEGDPYAGEGGGKTGESLRAYRVSMLVFGAGVILVAMIADEVVTALTIAYNILVAGLFVPILGGILWRRATRTGAYAAMAAGTVAVLAGMLYIWDADHNEPVYFGLALSIAVFICVSLMTKPVDERHRAEWDRRVSRSDRLDLSELSAAASPDGHISADSTTRKGTQ